MGVDCQNCQNRRNCQNCGRVFARRRSILAITRFWQFWQSSLVLVSLILTGCAVGPNYHRPDAPSAPVWKEQPPWRAASPMDSLPKGQWWTLFGDAELSQYEVQAIQANQTIEVARTQLAQARASARVTQSGLFPQLSAGIAALRARSSANRPASNSTNAVTQSDVVIPFNLSWEPDVFGGVRRSVESAGAQYQASAANLEN